VEAEGFDVGDDAPTVQGIDGGCKRRLPAVRNSVADLFEKGSFRKGLNLDTSQVRGQGVETLAHGGIAVIVLSMTLGAEFGIENPARLDLCLVGHRNGRL